MIRYQAKPRPPKISKRAKILEMIRGSGVPLYLRLQPQPAGRLIASGSFVSKLAKRDHHIRIRSSKNQAGVSVSIKSAHSRRDGPGFPTPGWLCTGLVSDL